MYETQMQDFSHLGNLVYCTLVMWPLDDSLFGQCVVSSIHGNADKPKLASQDCMYHTVDLTTSLTRFQAPTHCSGHQQQNVLPRSSPFIVYDGVIDVKFNATSCD